MNTPKPNKYVNKTILAGIRDKVVIVNNDKLGAFKAFMTAEWDKGRIETSVRGFKRQIWNINYNRTIKKLRRLDPENKLIILRRTKQ